jgi:hypothetical protein
MTDDRDLPLDHEPLNRAERRAARYKPKMGLPDPHAVGAAALPDESAPGGAVPGESAGSDGGGQSFARSGSGNVTHLTGAGTGGATETDERVGGHEGAHRGGQPNS